MEDEAAAFIHHMEMNSLDYFNFQTFSSESYSSYQGQVFNTKPTTVADAAAIHTWNSSATTEQQHVTPKASSSSSSQIISFGNQNSPPGAGSSQQLYGTIDCLTMKPKEEVEVSPASVLISQGSYHEPALHENYSPFRRMTSRTPLHAQDHVLAERKRREKLNQRFIALSALIPGLKKMDKATVLGDAAKYLKQLQERVKTLEEQTAKKVVESVVLMKKSRLSFESDHENSSSDENFECKIDQSLPEIEARVSDKNVLIRIHCENHKGYFAKILGEIEKLHLTVTNSSVLPFGTNVMDITVVAEMDDRYCMTVKDLVKNLKHALPKSM